MDAINRTQIDALSSAQTDDLNSAQAGGGSSKRKLTPREQKFANDLERIYKRLKKRARRQKRLKNLHAQTQDASNRPQNEPGGKARS
jgi:hypothetical protein